MQIPLVVIEGITGFYYIISIFSPVIIKFCVYKFCA